MVFSLLDQLAHLLTRKPKLVALIAVAMLIPSALGYLGTRVNYDILTYLPQDLESSRGERLLEEPFHMAATSMLIVEGMPAAYTNDLINAIKDVPNVSNALWLSNAVGIQIPIDFIPASLRDLFYTGEATMMVIQYEKSGADQETMEAPSALSATKSAFWRAFPWSSRIQRIWWTGNFPSMWDSRWHCPWRPCR